MEFMKCSIAGRKYGSGTTEVAYAAAKRRGIPCQPPDQTGKAFKDQTFISLLNGDTPKEIKDFLWMLSVCHAVIPEPDPSKPFGIAFQASSPDEGALVSAAADFGYIFKARKPGEVTVCRNGTDVTVQVLAVLEFTSERKRSSVIIRHPETNEIVLFCKGSDDLIMQRLAPDSEYVDVTREHLKSFAADGLRTLCAAYRVIDEDFFNKWSERYNAANCQLENREQAVGKVADEVESNLHLLGATAIEDKLQIGVPEAIESLLKAGIRVWILTGDKRETAINIGFACSLLSNEMKLIVLDSTNEMEIMQEINKGLTMTGEIALVASGAALHCALADSNRAQFFKLADRCQSVVCCRVAPIQKADVVKMVRDITGALCLAIGDGANDVGMILQADIGVGISGQEGMQAVLASDYSFAQFRFLKRLLLVHGRFNFKRNIDLINYSFYKNMAVNICQFLYGFFNNFSTLTIYDAILISVFNVMFTSAPPVVFAGLEREVDLDTALDHPEIYKWEGKRTQMLSTLDYWKWIILGIFHGLVCFFIPYLGMRPFINNSGRSIGYAGFGSTVYGCVICVTNFMMATMTSYWTWLNHFFYWGSICIYPLVHLIVDKFGLCKEITGFTGIIFSCPSFWLSVIGATILAILPIIAYNTIMNSQNTLTNRLAATQRSSIIPPLPQQQQPRLPLSQTQIDVDDEERVTTLQEKEPPTSLYIDHDNETGYNFEPPVNSFATVPYAKQQMFTTTNSREEIISKVRIGCQISTFGLDQL